MIQHCVNPACRTEFKLLNAGNLYAHERRAANTEFFWLCSTCAPRFDLRLDPLGRVAIHPRADFTGTQPPHPDHSLRLVARSTRDAQRLPWHLTTPAGEEPIASSRGIALGPFSSACEAA